MERKGVDDVAVVVVVVVVDVVVAVDVVDADALQQIKIQQILIALLICCFCFKSRPHCDTEKTKKSLVKKIPSLCDLIKNFNFIRVRS